MPRPPIRRGKAVNFTLDLDAAVLLYPLQPNSKGIGALVSELIRKEAERRAARPQMLTTLAAMQPHEGDE